MSVRSKDQPKSMHDRLYQHMLTLSDAQTWQVALMMVTFAGMRAQQIGRDDIEEACAEFVHTMHAVEGTVDLQEGSVQ